MKTGIPLVAKLSAHNCQMSWLCKQKVLVAMKTAYLFFPRCTASSCEGRSFPCQAKKRTINTQRLNVLTGVNRNAGDDGAGARGNRRST
jgi:hypothetical protein